MSVPPAHRQRRFGDSFEDRMGTAHYKLITGIPLGRDLTAMERRWLAVASAAPTHHLTLDSKSLSRREISTAWSNLHKRIERRTNPPLIYFAVPAASSAPSGYHLHVLLWEFVWIKILRPQAEQVGFGNLNIDHIGPTVQDQLWTATYVCGQLEPVFASEYHLRHRSPEKWTGHFFLPSSMTLEKHNPQLLVRPQHRESQFITDLELLKQLQVIDIHPMTPSKPKGTIMSNYDVQVIDGGAEATVSTTAASPLDAISSVVAAMKEDESGWAMPISLTVSQTEEVA